MFKFPTNLHAPHSFEFYAKTDYRVALNSINLNMYDRAKQLLVAQSCEGHAQEGHCEFVRRDEGMVVERFSFPSATIESIVRAIGEDPVQFRQERQDLIDDVMDMPDRLMDNPNLKRYENENGLPLFGIKYFHNIRINDPAAFLIGAYLASRVDNYDPWRKMVEDKHGIVMGGGECIAIHLPNLELSGFDLNDLSGTEWKETERKTFEELEIIHRNVPATGEMVSGYIRHKSGPGISDDVMTVLAGMIYGPDAFIGAFLTDAIDTWDKYTPWISGNGLDEMFGDQIKAKEEELKKVFQHFELPSDEEVVKFIYNVSMAKNRGTIDYKDGTHKKRRVADSSQRYFLQINGERNMSAFESHFRWLMGNQVPEFHIGWGKSGCTNHGIYRCVEERLDESY